MAGKSDDRFVPPAPIGTPYRSDPQGPAPFLTDADSVPVVPAEPAPYREPESLPKHEDSDPRTEYGAPPMFQPPGKTPAQKAAALTVEQKYARNAFWVGIASLFVFNVILGPIAIFMGRAAIKKGEREMGRRAIILGVIGTVLGILALVLSALGIIPPVSEMLDDLRGKK